MSSASSSNAAPAAPADGSAATPREGAHGKRLPLLVLGALGVVYGDIGTSPIYAFRSGIAALGGGAPMAEDVLGLLSLIAWSLTLVVSVKYVIFVMRADNDGEGGVLALTTLARAALKGRPAWVLGLGILGSGLFFGDSMITPAISVLSAIEGLETVAPGLEPVVVPLTVIILIALFAVQRFGTAKVSNIFGPVVIAWFLMLGTSGLIAIAHSPGVLAALNPIHAITFLIHHWAIAGVIVGAVFLAVTGAEALYADMGYFGRKPIAIAWFALVFPCLLLNYFGQGAFILSGPANAASDPFFLMFPDWARLPAIALTTAATVIASQAVISGAYSMAQQAMALGLIPRMRLLHTSETESGQIYMPQVNTLLLIGVLALVVGFGSSSALSSAYGIAVSGVMLVTSVCIALVMWKVWKWHPALVALAMAPLLLLDIGFFAANVGKIHDGGWFPASVAVLLAVVMAIWIAGRRRLVAKAERDAIPLGQLIDSLARRDLPVVPGTAVFLASGGEGAPMALLHSLKHYKVLHEHNVILTVVTADAPFVADATRAEVTVLTPRFTRVVLRFGYMETPNVPRALNGRLGWTADIMSTSYFVSRRALKPSRQGGPGKWIGQAFIWLSRNASDATEYFRIPTGRVVEIGTQVVL
jgi:KUP system potassium uptake protein